MEVRDTATVLPMSEGVLAKKQGGNVPIDERAHWPFILNNNKLRSIDFCTSYFAYAESIIVGSYNDVCWCTF